jgi:hypothetical protein
MKFIQPLIIFLDEDLNKSSQMLTNKHLDTNIKNCCQILMCSLYYMVGIRNKKIHKYYFCKERYRDSLNNFFTNYPLNEKPKFVKYNSQESKWCRKCKNHYDIIINYFECLLNEYSFRYGKDHDLYEMLDFLKMEPFNITLRFGYNMPYIQNLKIVLPWKNLPLYHRKKNIIDGYKSYYKHIIIDPLFEYSYSKRDIPEFLLDGNDINEFLHTDEFIS